MLEKATNFKWCKFLFAKNICIIISHKHLDKEGMKWAYICETKKRLVTWNDTNWIHDTAWFGYTDCIVLSLFTKCSYVPCT